MHATFRSATIALPKPTSSVLLDLFKIHILVESTTAFEDLRTTKFIQTQASEIDLANFKIYFQGIQGNRLLALWRQQLLPSERHALSAMIDTAIEVQPHHVKLYATGDVESYVTEVKAFHAALRDNVNGVKGDADRRVFGETATNVDARGRGPILQALPSIGIDQTVINLIGRLVGAEIVANPSLEAKAIPILDKLENQLGKPFGEAQRKIAVVLKQKMQNIAGITVESQLPKFLQETTELVEKNLYTLSAPQVQVLESRLDEVLQEHAIKVKAALQAKQASSDKPVKSAESSSEAKLKAASSGLQKLSLKPA